MLQKNYPNGFKNDISNIHEAPDLLDLFRYLQRLPFHIGAMMNHTVPCEVFPSDNANHVTFVVHHQKMTQTKRPELAKHLRQGGGVENSVRSSVHHYTQVHRILALLGGDVDLRDVWVARVS